MNKNAKGTVWMVVVILLIMAGLPAAYRLWTTLNPPPEKPVVTLKDFLEKAAEKRRETLLVTGFAHWTADDRAAEPALAAWAEAHQHDVLPWDWSAAAREKDFSGFLAAWDRILDEREAAVGARLRSARWSRQIGRARVWLEETLRSPAGADYEAATNAFGAAAARERQAAAGADAVSALRALRVRLATESGAAAAETEAEMRRRLIATIRGE